MILMFIGAIVGLFGFSFVSEGNYAVIIIGVVLFLMGICSSERHTARIKAEQNVTEYLAYGKEPDWKVRQRQKEENAETTSQKIRSSHILLRALVVWAVLFVVAFAMLAK